ncbi:unnamed protein product [Lactuca virosa]|uniref:Kinetochore protein Nuf2 N-terminal domain-containing protein n=1 Tax=Lactuca virosa TaxID=75947 RepID=A0AAU9N3C5_9ASTR|nr:unnamed protein product [Lactuca virosa]
MMNLFNKIRELISALDCPWKFTLKDLLKPEADRTEFFLGTILNFLIHSGSRLNELNPVLEDLTNLGEQQQEVEARVLQRYQSLMNQGKGRCLSFKK